MFSIVGQTRDQTKPRSLLARLRGRLDERPWERGRVADPVVSGRWGPGPCRQVY